MHPWKSKSRLGIGGTLIFLTISMMPKSALTANSTRICIVANEYCKKEADSVRQIQTEVSLMAVSHLPLG